MTFKDVERRREYHRNWMRQRREAWLAANGPCPCGSWEQLEVDHRDPSQKVTHRIWSWSEPRRNAELAKCQVLCRTCHRKKSNEALRSTAEHGTRARYRTGCRCASCRLANTNYARMRRGLPTSEVA